MGEKADAKIDEPFVFPFYEVPIGSEFGNELARVDRLIAEGDDTIKPIDCCGIDPAAIFQIVMAPFIPWPPVLKGAFHDIFQGFPARWDFVGEP